MSTAASNLDQSTRVRQHGSFCGRIGIAREDITPPIGIYSRNWGAAANDTAASIHRPLSLTALTLASSAEAPPLVLIEADLGWWRSMDLFRRFQGRLLQELSLDSARLLISLTHTHAAPPLMEPDPALPGCDLLEAWMERVFEAAVSAVRRSLASAEQATLDWHYGRCALAAARDLPDPDPAANRLIVGFNPPAAADDTLLVGRITDSSGMLRAVLVNYACHPTTLAWDNTSISPDYVGAMRQTIEEATGSTAFFLQGMSGDLAPKHQYVGDTEVADRHGRQLGFAALATLHDMEPAGLELCFDQVVESGAPLAVWRHQPHQASSELKAIERTVDVDLKDWPTANELEQQRLASSDRAVQERLRRQRDIRRSLGDALVFPLTVHVWKLGEAVLVGSPSEAYSQLQIDLRHRFPQLPLICMNLLNGWVGYLPPAGLYDVDVYPVWQTPFDRGCLERLAEKMTDTIEELCV